MPVFLTVLPHSDNRQRISLPFGTTLVLSHPALHGPPSSSLPASRSVSPLRLSPSLPLSLPPRPQRPWASLGLGQEKLGVFVGDLSSLVRESRHRTTRLDPTLNLESKLS